MFSVQQLTNVAAAVQAAEAIAVSFQSATTGPQKLQLAVGIATAVDPSLAAYVPAVQTLMSSLVGLFNMLNLFKKSSPLVPVPVVVDPAVTAAAPVQAPTKSI